MKERRRPELRDDVEIGKESRRKGGDMHNRCIMYFNFTAIFLLLGWTPDSVCAKFNGQFPWLSIESWAASSSEMQFLPVYMDLDAMCWISHCPATSCELWIGDRLSLSGLNWSDPFFHGVQIHPKISQKLHAIMRHHLKVMLVHVLSIIWSVDNIHHTKMRTNILIAGWVFDPMLAQNSWVRS